MTWVAPHIDYLAVAPMLVVFGAAVLGVLVEAIAPQRHPAQLAVAVAVAGLVGAFVLLLIGASRGALVTAEGAVAIDGPAVFLQAAILVLSLFAALLLTTEKPDGEVLPLMLFAVTGLLLMPAAHDLITLFVALEVLSLPLYVLCGLSRRRRLISQEASLKYFVLGGFSSAFYLYGAALVYGYSGSTSFADIGPSPLVFVGAGLIAVALLFKLGLAPFHGWVPDVYQGAPTPVTGFMAAATKVAAFGALLRLVAATGDLGGLWRPVLAAVAVLTMVVGAVVAVAQRDVKRMLGYSAISQGGFVLLGVGPAGLAGTLFYLAVYGFATLGSFAALTLIRGGDDETGDLASWAGIGRRSPLVAGALSLFLLALAGIPLTSGFTGKFALFSAAVAGGRTWLVVVAVLASAIAVFVYAKVIVTMFFREPGHDGAVVVAPGAAATTVLAAGALVTLVAGVLPQPLLGLATEAAVFLP
ncbi:NADH-quinone oxidoreductase subunit NuoN [Amycolatopsis sp. SID8362]|uniref:NADH-quinone oxidoreductase subunit NuoN n=1 Tax=Amycolatopsis sp. SID8362 TaxID=2690346 RepID=UPI00136DDF27|nr:NADH-quinone oxidoreductase subunit NuoN [Amycolatopsis sp. SID8362]NBH04368.1 NADH-quinone oxidoreductase subunit NuoN [Amycolatopsis sp. SID8362]NED41067.1 NADH-quinone oxidoreductase subunit NuoN [Amycolatopsis sp. SID8362]